MPMLEIDMFIDRFIMDLRKEFDIVDRKQNSIYLCNDIGELTVPIKAIYKDYLENMNYSETLRSYINMFDEVLTQYDFKIDYSNLFPIIYNVNFERKENSNLYRKHFALDLDILYVSDMGDTLRFIVNSDNVDFQKVQIESQKNINRMINIIEPLDKTSGIYCLKFDSDLASSFFLSSTIKRQISRKIGDDFLFALPSNTNFLLSKYNPKNINVLKNLIKADANPQKISNNIYRSVNANITFAEPNDTTDVYKY